MKIEELKAEEMARARLNDAAPKLLEAVRMTACPRPYNNRPGDFDAKSCFEAGECGCYLGEAIAQATGEDK